MNNIYSNADMCLHRDQLQDLELDNAIDRMLKGCMQEADLLRIWNYAATYAESVVKTTTERSSRHEDLLITINKGPSVKTLNALIDQCIGLGIEII